MADSRRRIPDRGQNIRPRPNGSPARTLTLQHRRHRPRLRKRLRPSSPRSSPSPAHPISIARGEAKMIDAEDFQIPGSGTLKNKLRITDPDALARMATESESRRLAELQESPIRGGFDTSHLQEIHHYLYQDVFDWAGELRRIEKGAGSASSL